VRATLSGKDSFVIQSIGFHFSSTIATQTQRRKTVIITIIVTKKKGKKKGEAKEEEEAKKHEACMSVAREQLHSRDECAKRTRTASLQELFQFTSNQTTLTVNSLQLGCEFGPQYCKRQG
jgi:hypothetical protein